MGYKHCKDISNFKELCIALCEIEGLKKEINIADMREVISQLSMLMVLYPDVHQILLKNGIKKLK